MFLQTVLIIAVISILLAVWSLRGINSKPDVDKFKKKLNKNRVIFQSHPDSSSGP